MGDVLAAAPGRPLRSVCRGVATLVVLVVVVVVWAPGIAPGGTGDPRAAAATATTEPGPGPVFVLDVSGTIDLGLAPYVDRVLGDAAEAGAAVVVVEIDTPGGRLDAVLQMRSALLDSPVPTVALVDDTAFSAGALVALASHQIFMTPGAVMGAATPVDGGTGEVADAKTISAVRATFEATAEERGRDPRLAAAMVDPDVVVEGLVAEGALLTLTTSQAVDAGYAEGVVADRAALLAELGLDDREQIRPGLGLAERLVRVVTNPVVASVLLTLAVLLVVADLVSGGIGAGVVVGVGLLATFFWGHHLAGLSGWEDVVLVLLGLSLIALEVFVVPGFGVTGVLGLATLMSGAFLAMISRDWDLVSRDDLVRAGLTVGVASAAVMAGVVVLLVVLSRSGPPGRLVLRARVGVGPAVTERAPGGWLRLLGGTARLPGGAGHLGGAPGVDAATSPTLVGATGTALTDLRPSGIADIDGRRVDVVTAGEYIRRDEPVEVVRDDGYRRVVARRP